MRLGSIALTALHCFLLTSCKDKPVPDDLAAAGYTLSVSDYHRAARESNVAVLQAFLNAGTFVDVKSTSGETALTEAAMSGKHEAVDWLLKNGADFTVLNHQGRSLLTASALGGSVRVMETLESAGAKRSPDDRLLESAAARGHRELVGWLAPSCAGELSVALEKACEEGQVSTIAELLKAGASVFEGRALAKAAEKGKTEAVKLLLAAGANRWVTRENGLLAWDLARQAGHTATADLLAAPLTPSETEPAGKPAQAIAEIVGRADVGIDLVLKLRLHAVREQTLPWMLDSCAEGNAVFLMNGETRPAPPGTALGQGWTLARVRSDFMPWATQAALLWHAEKGVGRLALPQVPIRAGAMIAVLAIDGRPGTFDVNAGDNLPLDGQPWKVTSLHLTKVEVTRGESERAIIEAHGVQRQ
jgi:hypothetical protein